MISIRMPTFRNISTLADSEPDTRVLEIQQQCDQNSVAIPCCCCQQELQATDADLKA